MEMRLREKPQQFSSALLQLAARYLFVQGVQVRRSTGSIFRDADWPG